MERRGSRMKKARIEDVTAYEIIEKQGNQGYSLHELSAQT